MGDQSAGLENRDCCCCRDTDEDTASAATAGKSGEEKGANCLKAIKSNFDFKLANHQNYSFLTQKIKNKKRIICIELSFIAGKKNLKLVSIFFLGHTGTRRSGWLISIRFLCFGKWRDEC